MVSLAAIRELKQRPFNRRMSTGDEDFSILICLDAMQFVFLSFFTLVEMI